LPAGCGQPAPPTAAAQPRDRESGENEAAPPTAERKGATSPKKKSKGPSGPHIGEIPKDAWPEIFFADPVATAKEIGPGDVAEPAPSATAKPASGDETAAKVEALPARRVDDTGEAWSALISGEHLSDETKAIRASLTAKMQSVGKYNGNYKDLRVDAATLAVLARVAADHPDPPSWKGNAKYVRDVSAEVAQSAAGLGEKNYKATRAAFDKLDALLSGSKPPQLAEAAERVKFKEVASRSALMLRIERAYNGLKQNVNNETVFKKEGAKVSHEGAVLAVLGRVIASPGYDDADLDDYQSHARKLQQSGLGIVEAVKGGDFRAFTAALEAGSKACVGCHQDYKNN
jgi:hypothetical protein